MLEFVEEALDEVALAVDREVDDAANADIGLAWDMGFGAAGLDQVDDGAGKEATIGDDVVGQTQPIDQRRKVVLSEAWPGVSTRRTGRPRASTTAWILVLSPPRERPMA